MKIEEGRCVYVIYNPTNNLVKIGASENPEKRKYNLELACGCRLSLTYASKYLLCAEKYEFDVHETFKGKRMIGEWFNVTAEEAIKAIKKTVMGATEDQIVEKYKKGNTITRIAKENGVTRQAILARLKKYGVYDKNGDLYEKYPKSPIYTLLKSSDRQSPLKTTPIQNIVNISDNDGGDMFLDEDHPKLPLKNLKRLESNINYNEEWYQVNIFVDKEFIYAYTKNIEKARDYIAQVKKNKNKPRLKEVG